VRVALSDPLLSILILPSRGEPQEERSDSEAFESRASLTSEHHLYRMLLLWLKQEMTHAPLRGDEVQVKRRLEWDWHPSPSSTRTSVLCRLWIINVHPVSHSAGGLL